ncbi:Cyclohexanone 1,2-monooxygenase, FAD-binding protein [Alloalcanivorax dieselolei B5]|uniref:Cyclohexanone 1,2-monooxygenase, FAD-binding protein n=1 Tax=Alcanivorax dieselolei (strain DSM 16502 / CGMCC 1.3690 / MCCC 1A00001 / B-5) TaxID=930169 RepID=K0CIV0_ALCDB|nr:NAD(P)/FAD-dependent oxidoreductase [Alloalcanivorax dieselolei]AFT72290.1 Cyclohexanone 1,2-monooxygenase, FAD-binding protein [Alloalcanivorax dieselolei B5]GGJ76764.1 hypothetical protein GCM10007426_02120 [Alloalcanivorax dieselolei]
MNKQQEQFQPAPLDVLIIGAGLSGIGAARALTDKCPDKRYIEEIAEESGAIHNIRFCHQVMSASWSSDEGLWTVRVKATDRTGQTREERIRTRFIASCSGYYSYDEGYRPEFPGESDFTGQIIHPQFWPEQLDYQGKRIVVIGSGATAVTLVPALAEQGARVTMLQRSHSYIFARPLVDRLAHAMQRWLPLPLAYRLTRWKNVLLGQRFFRNARTRPGPTREYLLHLAQRQVGSEVDMKHFTPDYRPWDQRVCAVPDGDLFHMLRSRRVDIVTDTIDRFTPGGIRLASGQELEADIIVTATGLKLNALGDVRLEVDGKTMAVADCMAYKGMMLSDVPNLMLTFGYTNASWTLKAELTCNYMTRLLRYMDRKGARIAVARRDPAVKALPFLDFSSGYVQRGVDVMPQQGDRECWRVHQNYLKDKYMIQYGRLDDGVLQFQ